MDIPKIISIANNAVNPTDAEKLKSAIYQLQQENLELKMKYQECLAKLQEFEDWEKTKTRYKEYKTQNDSIVYVKTEETYPYVFYCPVCFSKKFIIPLQKATASTAGKFGIKLLQGGEYYCPNCESIYHL